jgi:hypothetical protein
MHTNREECINVVFQKASNDEKIPIVAENQKHVFPFSSSSLLLSNGDIMQLRWGLVVVNEENNIR